MTLKSKGVSNLPIRVYVGFVMLTSGRAWESKVFLFTGKDTSVPVEFRAKFYSLKA